MEERVGTFFESGNGRVNWRYLPASNEIIWFSERDNWGHLYLYDLQTGKLKHQITTGEGNVTQLLRVDEKNRMLYFVGVGRETGRDPYFRHLYRVGFDGKKLELLTPEDADHDVSLSRRRADSSSTSTRRRIRAAGRRVARRGRRQLFCTLEKADISTAARDRLEAANAVHGQSARRHRPICTA